MVFSSHHEASQSSEPPLTGRKGCNAIVRNLILGYRGDIHPVNPDNQEIGGLACYASTSDINGTIDLSIVLVPAGQVSDALWDCAKKGIRGVIIETGGFAEIKVCSVGNENMAEKEEASYSFFSSGSSCSCLSPLWGSWCIFFLFRRRHYG